MTVYNFHCSQWHQAVTLCFPLRALSFILKSRWSWVYAFINRCLVTGPGLRYKRERYVLNPLQFCDKFRSFCLYCHSPTNTSHGNRLGVLMDTVIIIRKSEGLVPWVADDKPVGDHKLQSSVAARTTSSPSLRWLPEAALVSRPQKRFRKWLLGGMMTERHLLVWAEEKTLSVPPIHRKERFGTCL